MPGAGSMVIENSRRGKVVGLEDDDGVPAELIDEPLTGMTVDGSYDNQE